MKVAQLWRHPIKGHGHEALDKVSLEEGSTLPFDRCWAVAHETSQIDWDAAPAWQRCGNFIRTDKVPALMALRASFDEKSRAVTLSHPELEDLTFCPDDKTDRNAFLVWISPLYPENRARPKALYWAGGRGLTDSAFASVSLNSLSSLKELSAAAGRDVSPLRFRGNIWIDDVEPFKELDWVGKEIAVGTTRLRIVERTERCMATTANPETGQRDIPMLDMLEKNFGHLDFGVRAEVVQSGEVAIGDLCSI